MSTSIDRNALINIITTEALRLQAVDNQESFEALVEILNNLGWDSLPEESEIERMSRAVIALAPIGTDDDLIMATETAIWHREGRSSESYVVARTVMEPHGVKFRSCGCLAIITGDNCCVRAKVAS